MEINKINYIPGYVYNFQLKKDQSITMPVIFRVRFILPHVNCY
jgi:hypothetical protein